MFVFVRAYQRLRFGRVERVRAHTRRWPGQLAGFSWSTPPAITTNLAGVARSIWRSASRRLLRHVSEDDPC